MHRIVLASSLFAAIAAITFPLAMTDAHLAPASSVQRANICGWIVNPTPGNWWMTDRFGQWVLGSQGGEQVPGMDAIPDLTEKQWVRTNGYYGYGCGCMNATVDRKAMRVARIHSFKQKPLAVCRADPKLPKPDA